MTSTFSALRARRKGSAKTTNFDYCRRLFLPVGLRFNLNIKQMRNRFRTAIVCGLFSASTGLFAQENPVSQLLPFKKNIVKINLTSLAFKNASLQFEHVTSPKTSFALGVSFLPKTGLPFASTLSEKFGDNADAERAIETTKLSNVAITPEYRFYLGKAAPAGFYIAPFARYQHMSFEQVYSFTASNGKMHYPLIGGTINNIGGGVLLGAQWNLGSNLTFDWWIAGPIYGSTSGLLTGTDDMSDLSAQDRAKLESDIESVELPLTKLDATLGNNRVDVKLSGPYAGIRAFGFALGIKF